MNEETQKRFLIGLVILAILTPLGLLASGTAYGEWSSEELTEEIGYVPKGLEEGESMWSALFPDYSVPGLEGSFITSSIGYILSAIIGIGLIYLFTIALGKFISNEEKP